MSVPLFAPPQALFAGED